MEEIWKDVLGYEGYYQVSTLGRVRSVDRYINQLNRWGKVQTKFQQGRLLTPGESHDRYQSVSLCRNGITRYESVHRLVAIAFVPNPDDLPQVNHKDEDPSNNRADNLEWCTSLYNNNYGTRKERLSRSLSGKVRSEEYKQQMRQERAGRGNPMYGKQQSAEARAKISAALKGKSKSPEHVEKVRQKLIGHTPWNKGLQTTPLVCLDAGITFQGCIEAAEWAGGITPEGVRYACKYHCCCKGHVYVFENEIPENIQEYIDYCYTKSLRYKHLASRPVYSLDV